MIKLKMCLALALISATLLTALPFYSYADNAGQNEQKADVSLVSEDIVQIEEQPVVYAASSGG